MAKRIISIFLILVLAVPVLGSCADEKEESLPPIVQFDNYTLEEILQSMTLEQKIGQMLMLSIRSWNGGSVSDTIPEGLEKIITEYSVGNIILFADNFSSIEGTVRLTDSLQRALRVDIPMFISADQEGGGVTRISHGCSFIGNMALGAIGKEEDAEAVGKIMGQQLSALGVNLNLAPSLDVNNNPANPVINVRSFSEDPHLVSKLGVALINALQRENVSACAKHFPGHGDTEVDSHAGLPCIDKTLDEIKNLELIPFQAAIDSGIDMIMTAHIQFPKVESDEANGIVLPATLSKKILTDILKTDMGFNGVVITDSMHMGAISSHFTMTEASVLAINAGADILLMPVNLTGDADREALSAVVSAIKNAVESGTIKMERIDDAVKRILKVKKDRNLWSFSDIPVETKISSAKALVGCAEHKAFERELAAKCVTVLENKTKNLFADYKDGSTLLFSVPSASMGESVKFALERLKSENKIDINFVIREYEDCYQIKLDRYDAVVILTATTSEWDTQEALQVYYRALSERKKPAVISCKLPYDTALFTSASCLLACYCDKTVVPAEPTSAFGVNIGGALEVLFGISKGEGKLPVTVCDTTPNGNIYFNTVIYPRG